MQNTRLFNNVWIVCYVTYDFDVSVMLILFVNGFWIEIVLIMLHHENENVSGECDMISLIVLILLSFPLDKLLMLVLLLELLEDDQIVLLLFY